MPAKRSAQPSLHFLADGFTVGVLQQPPAMPDEESPPEAVELFFNGQPLADNKHALFEEFFSSQLLFTFVGKHTPNVVPMDKEEFTSSLENMLASCAELSFDLTLGLSHTFFCC